MTPKNPLISLTGINRSYQLGDQTLNVLKNINLNIYPQDFIAIVGPSGSGKSTLLYLLGLLDKPTSGTIKYNGLNVTSLSGQKLARLRNRQLGFIFQQYNLLERHSALDNVLLPSLYSSDFQPNQAKTKAKALLAKLGLAERLDHRPNQLSGGQQQRVAIARALINSPQIIIADEPTGNLDSKTGQEIMSLLTKLNQEGHSIILVTHDKSVANFAHRQVHIKDGQLIQANK